MLKSDKIIAVKTRWFGLRVVTTSNAGEYPSIDIGWGSVVCLMMPTSTNKVYAPNYFDTFKLGQSLNPFSTEIIENTGTGNVMVTTNSGTAIIPKAPYLMFLEDK